MSPFSILSNRIKQNIQIKRTALTKWIKNPFIFHVLGAFSYNQLKHRICTAVFVYIHRKMLTNVYLERNIAICMAENKTKKRQR